MKRIVAGFVGLVVLSGVAWAQGASTASVEQGYAVAVAQSAFGNVTSQSFGLEAGLDLGHRLGGYVEFGRTGDTAPKTLGPAAQIIAGYLTRTQSAAVEFSVKQPVSFASGGVRYAALPFFGQLQPYVLGGFGIARVKRDVVFNVGGRDVTDTLNGFGVVLGTDLAGTTSHPMLTVGGGAAWPVTSIWVLDASYRFGRIFTEKAGTNVNRVGLGVGFRF